MSEARTVVLNYPDGTNDSFIIEDYEVILENLGNLKVVDTWMKKDGSVHFDLDWKDAKDILEGF